MLAGSVDPFVDPSLRRPVPSMANTFETFACDCWVELVSPIYALQSASGCGRSFFLSLLSFGNLNLIRFHAFWPNAAAKLASLFRSESWFPKNLFLLKLALKWWIWIKVFALHHKENNVETFSVALQRIQCKDWLVNATACYENLI